MKVLIINIDKNIFEPGSKSLERLKEYANFCEKLSVVVLTRRSFEPIKVGSLSVFATGSCCRVKYSFDTLGLAKKIMTEEKHDLVMTQDPFDTGHIGWLIKKRYKIPWQCQIHTDFLSPYFWRESFLNKIRVLLAKFLLPSADGIRVVSQRIKNSLQTENYKLKINPVVLPIFVDLEKFKTALIKIDLKQKYPQFDFIILMASRLTREKNIGIAIEAMKEILKRKNLNPKPSTLNPLLLIVGDGPEGQKLESRIQNLELSTNIKIENWTDDLISYYKTADLFLLTSNYEGYGRTVVEAMSAGLPVVMTDVGIAGELLIDDLDGRVVPVGSEKALAAAIMELKENFAKKEEFKQNNLKLLEKWPTKQEYLEKYKRSLEL